jgi:hypothetical protein
MLSSALTVVHVRHNATLTAWYKFENERSCDVKYAEYRAEAGYNDIGLYDTSPITSHILSQLTITLHSSVITTSVYTTPRL